MPLNIRKMRLFEEDFYEEGDECFMAAQGNKICSLVTSGMPLKQCADTILKNQPEEEEPFTSYQSAAPDISSVPSNWAIKYATDKLLGWLGRFIYRRCFRIIFLTPEEPVCWIRSVDALILKLWKTESFLIPSNIIFLYMICREVISSRLVNKKELRDALMMCLFVAYSYSGAENGYPVLVFFKDGRKKDFWKQCIAVFSALSGKMMRINNDPIYYAETFASLKAEGSRKNG